MRMLALLPLVLCLCGFTCSRDSGPLVSVPELPDLPAEAKVNCPPAETLDGTLGDLAQKDARLAIEYAKCSARHAIARDAYLSARQKLQASNGAAKLPAGQHGGP